MPGTNPVGAFAETLSTGSGAMTPATWFAQADANAAVALRPVDMFAPRPAAAPAMSVLIDPGFVVQTNALGQQLVTEQAAQTVAIAAAPSSPNSRIDLVVVDAATGAASVVTGTAGTSAVAPSIPAGKLKVALVSVTPGTASIVNANITDLRAVWGSGIPGLPWAVGAGTGAAYTAAFTPANSALSDGLFLAVRVPAANTTTAPTFAPDGLAAEPITKLGGAALAAGDIAGQYAEILLRYNLTHTRWELLNPAPNNFTLTSAEIIAALGFTPQAAGTAPTGAQIVSGLGYTPANVSTVGCLNGSAAVSTATAYTATSANFGSIILCTGSGTFNVTIQAPTQSGQTLTIFALDTGCVVNAVGASGVAIYNPSGGGSGPSASVQVSLGAGGYLKLESFGGSWLVAINNYYNTAAGTAESGTGGGS